MYWFMAALLTLGPLGVGATLGALSVRIRAAGPRRAVLSGLVAVGPVLAWSLTPAIPWVNSWDVWWVSGLLSAGGGLGAMGRHRRAGPGEVGLLLGSVALALLIAEVAARTLLPAPPSYPPPESARLLFPERHDDEDGPALELARGRPFRCEGLYPDRYPGWARARLGMPGRPRVLHVGDSMVEALGIARPLTDQLNALDPAHVHVNAGVSTTGPDYQHVLISQWASRFPLTAVVQHVYTSNDLEDMDYRYQCCGGRPLMDWDAETPAWRCPEPAPVREPLVVLAESAPPYALRVATGISVAARHACRAIERLNQWIATPNEYALREGPAYDRTMWEIDRLVGANARLLTGRGMVYVMVILPGLRDLLTYGPDAERRDRIGRDLTAMAKKYGVPVLNATALLLTAIREGRTAELFIGPDGSDPHFTEAGHAVYAQWLQQHLEPLLGR